MQQSTNAQIQIGEMVAVLAVIIILLMGGIMWYVSGQTQRVDERIDVFEQAELLETLKEIQDLPEITCSIAGKTRTNCVDKYRAETIGVVSGLSSYNYYEQRFFANTRGTYKLELTQVYPTGSYGVSFFDYTTPNADQQISASLPVSIYDPITRTYTLGVLTLTQETTS